MDENPVRILLVEDNPGDARLLRETLRDAEFLPFILTHVGRLDEAIKCLIAQKFDALLLDLHLPDSEGLDTVKRIATAAPDVPIVVLTGTDDEALGTEAVRNGAQDYLVKGQTNHRLLTRAIRHAIERKRAADALRESEQKYRLLFDRNPDGVFSANVAGRFIMANAACEQICGYPIAELVQKTFMDLCAPDQLAKTSERFQEHIAGLGYAQLETAVIRKDGRRVELWIAGEPIRNNGEFVMHCTVKDITVRKAMEAALASAKSSAEQAKAVAEQASKAKDHFIAVLSHELRNPLNPVLATATMLRDDPRFDADTHEQLDVICRNAEMEARLIDDLLDVTRIERGKVVLDRQPLHLCTVIRRAVEVCEPEIKARGLDFRFEMPTTPYTVDADAGRLQQVFWNLIKNAVKFTPHGGRVRVRCRDQNDCYVIVEVSDSGEGMEPASLGRIFHAFEQTDRSITRQFGGLGLGLTISKALVELHGGSIQAHSMGKGKGSTFTVRLPMLPTGPIFNVNSESSKSSPLSPASSPRSLRILLVEDHGDTARVMRRLLSAQGHKVQVAVNIATALQLAGTDSFDVLLSDLGLPDGSGLDLMRSLRNKGYKMPGIALSGYGQESDIEQSRQAGFLAHLVKPLSLALLDEAIAKAIGAGEPVHAK